MARQILSMETESRERALDRHEARELVRQCGSREHQKALALAERGYGIDAVMRCGVDYVLATRLVRGARK